MRPTAMRAVLVLVLLAVACTGAPPDALPTAAPTQTPAATSDPEAELRHAIRLREEWGLRADREWVQKVNDDPSAVESELGIRVTTEEHEELQRMLGEDERSALIAYGARNPETFAGMWVERGGGTIVLCFTRELERHRQASARLAPPGADLDIRQCRFTEAELRSIMDSIDFDELRREGIQPLSMGLDTMNNVVRLEAKSNLPGAKEMLEARYGGRLVADIHPLPGPWQNSAGGEGWRLLAAGIAPTEGYVVRVATNQQEWQELWSQLDPVNEAPEVDLVHEIVVSFGHGIGSTCQEVRLDDVVIDHQRSVVYSVASDPLAPRGCTADLVGGAYFVVALEREALPESPFTVQLTREAVCASCEEERKTVDLR